MQSPMVSDLFSASYFFLEGDMAIEPLPNMAIARLWPMRALNWLLGSISRYLMRTG
jgi:hypothetical protein